MPEGPQVRKVANIIATHIGHQIIEIRHPASREPWSLMLPVTIEAVETKGKNIFIYLAHRQVIYNHMLMWGWWLPTIEAVGKKRLNTAFITNHGNFGYYGGGILKLISAEDAEAIKAKLGPDMLLAQSANEAFEHVIGSDLPIGEALLAQELVSGIGNIYKSEALFIGKVNPLRRAHQVTPAEFDRIYRWLKPQMMTDIGRAGKITTTSAEAAKAGKWNFVYRRYHQPCLICNTKIERIYQGKMQRSTYYCPNCQGL